MNLILAVDADSIVYQSCIVAEFEAKWDEENHYLAANVNEATNIALNSVKSLVDRFGPCEVVLCFTVSGNFREKLGSYKSNRKNTRKPLCFSDVKKALCDRYRSRTIEGLEADDICGLIATNPANKQVVVVSDDKDLKTIPCRLFRQNELIEITPEEADYNWMFQTLAGDTADGYPGCPGIGPKTAEKILLAKKHPYQPQAAIAREYWQRVVSAYEKAGLTEDDAITQARFARILRWGDYDETTKEVKLWKPATA